MSDIIILAPVNNNGLERHRPLIAELLFISLHDLQAVRDCWVTDDIADTSANEFAMC